MALAVVGTPRSGKSTFIQHALDLKKLPTAAVSSKKVSLEGVVSLLRIHEFNVNDIDLTSGGTPQWPHLDGKETTSPINGAMVIYSISDASSTKLIPSFLRESKASLFFAFLSRTHSQYRSYARELIDMMACLGACSKSAMPTVLVCSKCDVAPQLRQVDSQTTEHLRQGVVGNIQIYHTAIKAPDSHKRCLSSLLRNIGLRNTGMVPSTHSILQEDRANMK